MEWIGVETSSRCENRQNSAYLLNRKGIVCFARFVMQKKEENKSGIEIKKNQNCQIINSTKPKKNIGLQILIFKNVELQNQQDGK